MGVGTTAVACISLNRRYIGTELNPRYIEIAKKRIKRESSILTLDLVK
jgi:DNA modification methylase